MIGFSIEFKRYYIVVRGPKGRIYLAFGFAKRMPVFTPTGTLTITDLDRRIDDSHSAVLSDELGQEEDEDEEIYWGNDGHAWRAVD